MFIKIYGSEEIKLKRLFIKYQDIFIGIFILGSFVTVIKTLFSENNLNNACYLVFFFMIAMGIIKMTYKSSLKYKELNDDDYKKIWGVAGTLKDQNSTQALKMILMQQGNCLIYANLEEIETIILKNANFVQSNKEKYFVH